jgi:CPA1 family monovalent cation:H+ antiporter
VIATFKGSGAKGRLKLLVEAESLFNDGTAASIFAVALAISAPTLSVPLTGLHIVALVFSNFFGGILCGLIVGGITLAFAWRTSDHLIEMTFTTVAAYGSFLLADSLHCSGVISAMCAGLVMGNAGYENTFTEKGKEALEPFWEFIAFVSNSIIFILMGQALTKVHFQPIWRIALEISLLVMIARAVSVVACCAPFVKGKQAVNLKHQTALIWGGLRGALALALAMALPESIPHRSEIIGVVFSVVGFSIIVQGLTMPNLLRKIGETGRTHIH